MKLISAILLIAAVCHSQNSKNGTSRSTTNASQKEVVEFTKALNVAVYQEFNLDDKTAFENVDRGFIAPRIDNGDIEGIMRTKLFTTKR